MSGKTIPGASMPLKDHIHSKGQTALYPLFKKNSCDTCSQRYSQFSFLKRCAVGLIVI